MKIAVTGATGHLGASLIPLLLSHGHEITALAREDLRALDGFNLKIVKGSLADENEIHELLEGNEILIHCASKISITRDKDQSVRKTNVEETARVIQIAKQDGIRRMIYLSSIHHL